MEKLNLIYGKHAVEEFLEKHPQLIKKIWVKDRIAFTQLQKKYINQFPILHIDGQKIEKIIGEDVNHQGWLAEIKEYNYLPFLELEKQITKRHQDLILVLDQIHDPYNFGAIIRSASLLGVKNILILNHRQVAVNSTVVKTSAGTVYDLQISKVNNLSQTLNVLKKNGYWIYASNLNQKAVDIRQVKFAAKTVLIIGNEEKGVSELVTKNSDQNVFVPSNKNIDSFNASVATALILYEIANQLKLI